MGNAEVKKAYSEARRLAYQELGRAEGQAEMLVSIAQAVEGIDLTGNRAKNIRHVLLARTAQILEAMRDSRMDDQPPAGG